jgi:xanthine/uracil/vitamin C permease (AzgA family)
MADNDSRQHILDEEHLRLLSIGYWISGATTAFFSLFALMYVAMGFFVEWITVHTPSGSQQAPPRGIGLFIAVFGLGFFLILIALAGLKFYAGLCIKRRKARGLCLVVAGVSCLGIPYGTVLGVFSFVVLTRTSVAALFDPTASMAADRNPVSGT